MDSNNSLKRRGMQKGVLENNLTYFAVLVLIVNLVILFVVYNVLSGANARTTGSFSATGVVNLSVVSNSINIELVGPNDGFSTFEMRINFVFKVDSINNQTNISNCSIRIDSVVSATIYNVTKKTNREFIVDIPLGDHIWNVICTASNGTIGTSGSRVISIHEKVKETPSGGGSSAGGSGTEVYYSQWICSDWGECIDNWQYRTCEKESKGYYAGTKPEQIRNCSSVEEKNIKGMPLPPKNVSVEEGGKISFKFDTSSLLTIAGIAGIIAISILIGKSLIRKANIRKKALKLEGKANKKKIILLKEE